MAGDDDELLVRRLFEAVTARDLDGVLAVMGPGLEFHAVTAARTRGGEPYRGEPGMRDYFADVARVYRELRVIPQTFRTKPGGVVLAIGRVYARDLEGTIIDSPAGWLLRTRGKRIAYVRVFQRAEEAVAAFEAEP
jgi:uncharacterized protein